MIQAFFTDPGVAPFLTIGVVILMFALFATETYPTEVVALAGGAILMAAGILTAEDVLEVFTNPAPWTIAAMFVLSGALVRTGALNAVAEFASARAKASPAPVLAGIGGLVLVASAFMNNTPVVVMLIPVVIQLGTTLNLAPSKLLIPLSYTAILGGMCTLIGTSTNLLVDGVARAEGLAAFSLFEVTPIAVLLAAAGLLYLRLVGPKLLPDRTSMAGLLGNKRPMKFLTQVSVPAGSPLIGQTVLAAAAFKRPDIRVVDILRGDESLRRQLNDVELNANDRLVIRTNVGELLSLKGDGDIELVDRIDSRETTTVEALITPGCRMIGRTLGEMRLRRRFGVYVLAVHRMDQNIGTGLDDIRVRIGDTLLIEGNEADIGRLARDMRLVDMSKPTDLAYRRQKAPLALAALGAVVGLSAFGVAPLFSLAIIAVAFVLVTRCIDAEEAFSAVDARLLVLIFSMLGVGKALQTSGAVEAIVGGAAPLLDGLPAFFVIWAVFLLTSVLTELVSNNAVAVTITPVAIALAAALGIDPRPLVITVMLAASASFSTPIGYQTNTLVYGPGGYKFTDFLWIGAPLNLLIGFLTAILVPLMWPLT